MSNSPLSKQNALADLESQILAWPGISKHPHSYGGTEFRFGGAEVGHLHDGDTLDIPLPKAVHDEILTQGLAEEHGWVPNSGWTTFRIRNADDMEHARWLMRLGLRINQTLVPISQELWRPIRCVHGRERRTMCELGSKSKILARFTDDAGFAR